MKRGYLGSIIARFRAALGGCAKDRVMNPFYRRAFFDGVQAVLDNVQNSTVRAQLAGALSAMRPELP